ncbi:LOW QUALITY PROTEIN: hypothetical protein PHPALM_30700 [Phytophthora palmivora]|uniref:Uncharacterized protein n=1 Tax=Phytophthora palmivora TaxID=4796 RepID=A0A2P4X4J0_9STRA|nr:LOW QUALITY PROTEIN: hypothetical protein PHPALM_30700 [Phytophthora palmivora]
MQWHLITRIDDMMKLNIDHPGTLICQLCWSKNISKERDTPEQIVLGSIDSRVCVLLNMGVYVEATGNASLTSHVFGNPHDGDRVVSRFLQEIFDGTNFHKLKAGNLGTHSLRKGAATYGSRCGLSKDYGNRRGRWHVRKSIVDVYIDNAQPYPDAVATGALTRPLGPCCYIFKKGVHVVNNDLLINQVGPVIKKTMGEAVERVLALPLLWASLVTYGSFDNDFVPPLLKQMIVHAYICAGGNEAVNPEERVPVHIVGDGARLLLVETHGVYGAMCLNILTETIDGTRKEFAAIHSQLFGMQRQFTSVLSEVLPRLPKVLAVLQCIAIHPVARTVQPHPVIAASGNEELWTEHEVGLHELKPAKEFTASERGANEFPTKRYTSDVAIDNGYAVYGRQLSMTRILVALQSDKRKGGYPSRQL